MLAYKKVTGELFLKDGFLVSLIGRDKVSGVSCKQYSVYIEYIFHRVFTFNP